MKPISRTELQKAVEKGFEGHPIDPKSFEEKIAIRDLEYPRENPTENPEEDDEWEL